MRRPSRPEGQRAFGFAEIPWVVVSIQDRDLLSRDRTLVAVAGASAGYSRPDSFSLESRSGRDQRALDDTHAARSEA